MKMFTGILPVFAAFVLCGSSAMADAGYSFNFTTEQKKLDSTTGSGGIGINSTKEKWAYKVTMENKSFKDAPNIEIKYLTFMRPDQAGEKQVLSKVKLKRSKLGSVKLAVLKNFDKYTFVTDPMMLIQTQLQPGYGWANGASPRSKDALRGLWLRVFVDGQQVCEFANPPELKEKEKWEDAGSMDGK